MDLDVRPAEVVAVRIEEEPDDLRDVLEGCWPIWVLPAALIWRSVKPGCWWRTTTVTGGSGTTDDFAERPALRTT